MLGRSIIICAGLALAACDGAAPDAMVPKPEPSAADAPARAANGASFDCSRARGQAQQLVCSDAALSALDREADLLSRAAPPDPSAQTAFATARDECWRDDELRQCVVDRYAARIHALRAAGAAPTGSRTIGPVAFDCGLGKLAATFVNTDPGLVHLVMEKRALSLPQAPSASGARYAARVEGEAWQFWNKGSEATLERSDDPPVTCREVADG